MIHLAISRRNGTSTTASCSRWPDFRESMFHKSIMFIFSALPIWPHHLKCSKASLTKSGVSGFETPLSLSIIIVSFLFSKGQSEGIWAWDCVHKEPVLLIPSPISLLGDNPMQSEFACHVGSHGKYFCRACHVKGTDVEDSRPQGPQTIDPNQTPPNSPAPSNRSDSDVSQAAEALETGTAPAAGKRKTAETMEAMVRRITDFMKVNIFS